MPRTRNDRKIYYCKNSESSFCSIDQACFNVIDKYPQYLRIDDMYEFNRTEVKRIIKLCKAFLNGEFKKGFVLISKDKKI
jgi:hypothetical protein